VDEVATGLRTTFRNDHELVTALVAAGVGKYSFRARLRQLTSNATSGYSAAKSVTLS
jgi:hypothetical protein